MTQREKNILEFNLLDSNVNNHMFAINGLQKVENWTKFHYFGKDLRATTIDKNYSACILCGNVYHKKMFLKSMEQNISLLICNNCKN